MLVLALCLVHYISAVTENYSAITLDQFSRLCRSQDLDRETDSNRPHLASAAMTLNYNRFIVKVVTNTPAAVLRGLECP